MRRDADQQAAQAFRDCLATDTITSFERLLCSYFADS